MLLVGSPANYIRGGKARRDNLYFFLSLIWLTAVVGALIFAPFYAYEAAFPDTPFREVRTRACFRCHGATSGWLPP